MSQYVVSAIEAYKKQLASINSAVINESLTHDEANLKISEINNILEILENILHSSGDNKLLNNILIEVEVNNSFTDENKNYLINTIKSSRLLDKPNFFYNELLVKAIREKIPDGSKLTLTEIINELIIIYTDLQKYYEQYKDIFRFNTNVQNSFNSKVSGLKEILKLESRGSLTHDLCKTFIDGRLEPTVFELITSKLRREQYEGFKAIDRSGLYIEIYSFPPEYSEIEAEFKQRIIEVYSDDFSVKFDHQQPSTNHSLSSKIDNNNMPQLFNPKQPPQPLIVNPENIERQANPVELDKSPLPQLDLKQLNEIKSKLENLSQLAETLITSNKESFSANQKILAVINNLGNDEEHYLAQLSKELSKHLSNILQELENNKTEFTKLLNEYNSNTSPSSSSHLVNVVTELNNKLVSINKTSENLNNITSFLAELKTNITTSFQESVTNLTDLIHDAVKKNINSDIISKAVLDMISFSNNSATEKIEKVAELIKTNLNTSVTEYTEKASAIEEQISEFGRSMAESFITGADKVTNAVTEFKTELGRQQKNSDLEKYKSIISDAKLEIDAAKNELTGSNNDLKNFINDKFLTRLSDLQKTVNTNSGFLDTNNRNNTYRKGYVWSVATTIFSAMVFVSIMMLIYTIKSSSSDTIELNRIMNNLSNIDKQNQSAIKKILDIK